MKKLLRDFRGITFVPGQQITYVRRGADGKIFLQLAKIEEVNVTTVLDQVVTGSLMVLRSDGKKYKLTRFNSVAVLAEER